MNWIVKPCDWETITLALEQDPNKFGEALRGYCFVGNCVETGCYSTFELLKEFKEIKNGKIYEEFKQQINADYEDEVKVYIYEVKEKHCYLKTKDPNGNTMLYKVQEPFIIVVAWYWDGDGTLYFRWNNRSVINTDCKKDHDWQWIKE